MTMYASGQGVHIFSHGNNCPKDNLQVLDLCLAAQQSVLRSKPGNNLSRARHAIPASGGDPSRPCLGSPSEPSTYQSRPWMR